MSRRREKGSIFFGLDNSAKFSSAVGSVTGTIDDDSDDGTFKNYRLLLKKLDKHFSKMLARSLTSRI